jgi:hypothetical protein
VENLTFGVRILRRRLFGAITSMPIDRSIRSMTIVRNIAITPTITVGQLKSSEASPFLRFHLTAARSAFGAGGPIAPQSGHWIVNVPRCTIWGRSPQNGQGLSIGMI